MVAHPSASRSRRRRLASSCIVCVALLWSPFGLSAQCTLGLEWRSGRTPQDSLKFVQVGPLRLNLPSGLRNQPLLVDVSLSNAGERDAYVQLLFGELTPIPAQHGESGEMGRTASKVTTALHAGARDIIFSAAPDSVVVPSHDSALVRVRIQTMASPPGGDYVGYLIAQSLRPGKVDGTSPSCGRIVAVKQVLLTRVAPPSQISTDGLATVEDSLWSVTATRLIPFMPWLYFHGSDSVPLVREAYGLRRDNFNAQACSGQTSTNHTFSTQAGGKSALGQETTTATADSGPPPVAYGPPVILTSAAGHTAVAEWCKSLQPLSAGIRGVVLKFRELRLADDYNGVLQVNQSGHARVRLAVHVKDFVVWPTLALAFGLLLANRVQRYTTRERAYWLLVARLRRARRSWETAQDLVRSTWVQVGATAHPHSTRGFPFDITADLRDTFEGLLGDLDQLRLETSAALDEQNAPFVALRGRINTVETTARVWASLATDVAGLEMAQHDAQQSLLRSGYDQVGGAPPPLTTAEELLTARSVQLSELAALHDRLTNAATLLRLWSVWLERMGHFDDRFVALSRRAAAAGVDVAASLPSQMRELRALIVEASTQSALGDEALRAAVRTVEASLDALQASVEEGENPTAHMHTMGVTVRSASPADPVLVDRLPLPTLLLDESSAEAFVRRRDRDYALLAFLVAVGTGLLALYVGKPFGTMADYLKAVLWGFGAKAGLDVLLSGVDRLLGRVPGASA